MVTDLQSNSKSLPKGNLDSYIRQGVVFVTYSLLVQGSKEALLETPGGEQPDAANTRLTRGSRLEQIVNWLKGDEKPLIVLDECHKAKNLMVSKGARPPPAACCLARCQRSRRRIGILRWQESSACMLRRWELMACSAVLADMVRRRDGG